MSTLSRQTTSSLFRPIAVLVVVLLVGHSPMLLNDGLYIDDWLVLRPRPDYPIDLDFLLHGAGHPIFYSYDVFANWTNAPIGVMVSMALAGILLGAICLALTATRLDLLDRAEAVGVALIVWTYPGYQLWAGKANSVYVFSFGLSIAGAWLLTLAYGARGVRRLLLRAVCALVFLLSFALNSTIVLFAFVVLGLFVAIWRRCDAGQGFVRRTWFAAWRCVRGYPELMVLPLAYWAALNLWFKRIGLYAQHYDVHLPNLGEIAEGWKVFFAASYGDVAANAARAVVDSPKLFFVTAALVSCALLPLCLEARPSASRRTIALPMVLAVLLFLALSLPYLIAGLRPSTSNFYESRHLLMFGLPAALMLLAFKRLVERWANPGIAFAAVFGLGAILSVNVLWSNYIFMQARTLKLEALGHDLAGQAQPGATVYGLVDGFADYPSRHLPFGITEVTGMLRLAWGDQPFVGFDLRGERPSVLQEIDVSRKSLGSAFGHFDPTGPQATISMQPGPEAAPNQVLVRKYYACRLLARCDVSQFLGQIAEVTIKLGPISGILPLDSPQPSR